MVLGTTKKTVEVCKQNIYSQEPKELVDIKIALNLFFKRIIPGLVDQLRELDDTLFLFLAWLGLGDKADLVLIPFLPKIPERAEGAWLHQ